MLQMSPGSWESMSSVLLCVGKEILDRFSVQLRKLKQFHDIHPAVAGFTFRQERVGQTQGGGNLSLGQSGFLASLN
jgi:hypothetical protein